MKSSRAVRCAAMVAVALMTTGCPGPTDNPPPEGEQFAATLTVDQVVGGNVQSSGSGSASLVYADGVLSYTIDVADMTGITMAHIHGAGSPTTNAGIRAWLFSPAQPTGAVNGRLVTGTITATSPVFEGATTLDDVLRLMRADSAYVLVHTSVHPDGEIRGHITR